MPLDKEVTTRDTAILDFEEIGENIAASYRIVAAKYRSDDEIEIQTQHHRHLKAILSGITSSFHKPISVLDLGCGTGKDIFIVSAT